jgi:hypothetical protein
MGNRREEGNVKLHENILKCLEIELSEDTYIMSILAIYNLLLLLSNGVYNDGLDMQFEQEMNKEHTKK